MADTLTVKDNRTGKTYEIPISEGAIRATDLKQIKTGADDGGLFTYDPAFMNTAACKSRGRSRSSARGTRRHRPEHFGAQDRQRVVPDRRADPPHQREEVRQIVQRQQHPAEHLVARAQVSQRAA